MNTPTIRFGYTDDLQSLPLLHPLLAGWVYPNGFRLELVAMLPQQLNEAVAGGALDGALLDPVSFAKLRSAVEPLPGIGLASEGANAAAVLVSSKRADDLDGATITLLPGAAGGAAEALLRVLLQPYFGIDARIEPAGDPQSEGEAEPRVLAGDEAARARLPWLIYEAQFSQSVKKAATSPIPEPDPAQAGYVTDLGAAWWVLTGMPFVWSVAAIRQDLLAQERVVVELVRAFRESRRSAQEQLETVVSTAARRVSAPEEAIRLLFAAQHPEIAARDHAGLNVFYDHTRRLRLT